MTAAATSSPILRYGQWRELLCLSSDGGRRAKLRTIGPSMTNYGKDRKYDPGEIKARLGQDLRLAVAGGLLEHARFGANKVLTEAQIRTSWRSCSIRNRRSTNRPGNDGRGQDSPRLNRAAEMAWNQRSRRLVPSGRRCRSARPRYAENGERPRQREHRAAVMPCPMVQPPARMPPAPISAAPQR